MAEALSIPRAMSVRTNSPLWRPDCFEIGPLFDVLVDGEPVAHVIAYDCDEGWTQAAKVNDEGRKYVEDGRMAEQMLYGTVTVRERSHAKA